MPHSIPTAPLERPRQLLALAFAVAGFWYLAWRWATFNMAAPWVSGLLLAAETLGVAALLAQVAITARLGQRQAPAAAEPLGVDVFVLAGTHEQDVLRKTLRSALALNGPHSVTVLADQPTTSDAQHALRALTQELGCGLVMADGQTQDLAALANLALQQGSAPLIAWLDGDQACRRDFLSQVQGHFNEPQLAFVQTAPAAAGEGPRPGGAGTGRRRWWLDLFALALPQRIQMRGWDRWQATVWAGNGAVLRRSALAATGGFTGGAAPYLPTTVRLQASGAHGAWHDERLTFSLAPEAHAARVRARATTVAQAWSALLRERVLGRDGLTLAQRLRHVADALATLAPLHTSAFLILPAIVLAGAALPVDSTPPDFPTQLALHLLPLWLLGTVLTSEISRGEVNWLALRAHRMARLGRPAQVSLLALNAMAVLWGATMAITPSTRPGLSAVAAGLMAAWAAVNLGGLVLARLAAARTTGRERARQRFTVTLAAELVNTTGERVQGTVDDLSEAGLRFYGSLLPSMAESQTLSGTLHLPDGPLAFNGEVRHLGSTSNESMHQPRSVGMQLALDAPSKARVEAFLFSSDLQWRIQGHAEPAITPLGRLLPSLVPPPRPALARRHWNGAQLRLHILAEATPVLCAAGDGQGSSDLIVSHAPLPEGEALILDVFRRMAVPSRGVKLTRLADSSATANGATALYTYRVDAAEMPIVPMAYQTLASPFIIVNDEPLLLQPADLMPA
jgi:cellulose synthase (UDP-forming)